MRTSSEVSRLLDVLENVCADDLESQDLDFKEWISRSRDDAIDQVVEMAVCMANGGGGTVVFGVNDKALGRAAAIRGIPLEIDANRLMKAVYDRTDPKLTPVFEDLTVPEGTGRILCMHVSGGLPPYTDSRGNAKIRIGKDCQPLTGSLRRSLLIEMGETDFTAQTIEERIQTVLSPAAAENLRTGAARAGAPADLTAQTDLDFLGSLGLLRGSKLTRAAVFLIGKPAAVAASFPQYTYTYARFKTATSY